MSLPKNMTGKIRVHLLRKVLQDKLADATAIAVITNQADLAFAQGSLFNLDILDLVAQTDFPHNIFFGDPFGFH
jgi:hypothetical protein